MDEGTFESVLYAAQTGAEWAVAALYRELHPSLLRYLTAQEPADGEDLASEVWLDVGRGLGSFEGDEHAFRGWLFTIARRRLIDHRRRARRRTTSTQLGALVDHPDPTDVFAEAEVGTALTCLRRLTSEQAEVVLLRVVAGLDSAQVASVLGKKPGTVRVIQKRALDRLAELVCQELKSGVTR
jgi:RNA polymerase sigma-70 factor (ECF subfamily)